MPLPFRDRKAASPPIPPAEWRLQAFGLRGHRAVADPVIEPGWGGVRVMARVSRMAAPQAAQVGPDGPDGPDEATVTLVDEDGLDATADFPEQALAIGAAALADELILDGYLTVEATQPSEGRADEMPLVPSPGQVMTRMLIGGKPRLRDPRHVLDPNRPIAFVAVDLLLIDGTPLLDLPLIERKRLLEGALRVGEIVRITPFTRPPVGSFAQSWYGLGFRRLVYKGANGRYNPGGAADDWATVSINSR